MKSSTLLLAAVAAAIALPAAAQDIKLRGSRVGGPDPATIEKMGRFYAQVLGLKETRRITRPEDATFLEIIMNFGATADAAKAATTPSIVLITAPKGTVFPHPTSNLIFEVKDAAATAAKAPAAGGTISRPAAVSAASGSTIAFVNDPAGNRVELIQPKR